MKKTNLYATLVLLCATIWSACGDKESAAPVPGNETYYHYIPSSVGHEVIYDVSLITKDEFSGTEDTSLFQLKEIIESVFTDISNRPTQRIERFTRADSTAPWVIADVWTANLLSDRYEKNEENNTYVKLKFPVIEGTEWNGNLYNTLPAQTYLYTEVDEPAVVNGMSFDSTLTVLQSDYEDLLEKSFAVEQYASGVGLVYKESVFVKKDFNNPGSIKAQTKYRQTIVSYTN